MIVVVVIAFAIARLASDNFNDSSQLPLDENWSRFQLSDYLRKKGLALSCMQKGQSVAESLVTCLVQHSSQCFWSLNTIQGASEKLVDDENQLINFRLRLSEITQGQPLLFLARDVLSLMDKLNIGLSFVITCASERTIRFRTKNASLLVWQDIGSSGLFHCIVEHKKIYQDQEDYIAALIGELHLIRDVFFRYLDRILDDKDAETEAARLQSKLKQRGDQESSSLVANYLLDVIRQHCGGVLSDDLICLQELANFGQLTVDQERDLREEICDCLSRATQDTYLRRKNDYETACRAAIERENENERQNLELERQIKVENEEIDRLEAEIKIANREDNRLSLEHQEQSQRTQELIAREENEKKVLADRIKAHHEEQMKLQKQKSQAEDELKEFQTKLAQMRDLEVQYAWQKKMTMEQLQDIQREINVINNNIKETQESIGQLDTKQRQCQDEIRRLEVEHEQKARRMKQQSDNLNLNRIKVQTMKETRAWLEFQNKLAQSVPSYELAQNRKYFSNSILNNQEPTNLLRDIISKLNLKIKYNDDLRSYAQNQFSANGDLEKVRKALGKLIADAKLELNRQP